MIRKSSIALGVWWFVLCTLAGHYTSQFKHIFDDFEVGELPALTQLLLRVGMRGWIFLGITAGILTIAKDLLVPARVINKLNLGILIISFFLIGLIILGSFIPLVHIAL